MSQEGHESVKNASDLCSEDVSTLSPCTGKRCREENLATADDSAKASDLDLCKETAPLGGDQNGGEEKADSGENLQSGKRIKAEYEKATEDTPKNVEKHSDDIVSVTASEKALEHAAEIEAKENSQFHCSICTVYCTSEKDYNTHVSGKRHARAQAGVVTTRPSKVRKLGVGTKANISMPPETAVMHEDRSLEQQVLVDGFITGKDLLSSCTGGTKLQEADLQDLGRAVTDNGKDVIMEQDPKEGVIMETLEAEIAKHGCKSKIELHNGNRNAQEALTNGSMHKTLADQLANCSTMDSGSIKSNSECVVQALAIAMQACACPGLEGLLKSDTSLASRYSAAAGAVSSTTPVTVMHAHCLVNLLHDVRAKALEDRFQSVAREERAGGLTLEALLPSIAPCSAKPAGEKDLNCSVCRVEYGSKSDLELHVAGKKHTSLVRRLHLKCNLCNVSSNSEKDLETHMNGKKHASKVRLVQKRVAFEKD